MKDQKAKMTLRGVLNDPESLNWSQSLYLPSETVWGLDTPCLVIDCDEDEEAELAAESEGYAYALSIQTVQAIARNLLTNRGDVDEATKLEAFLHYYDNDAFISAPSGDRNPESGKAD